MSGLETPHVPKEDSSSGLLFFRHNIFRLLSVYLCAVPIALVFYFSRIPDAALSTRAVNLSEVLAMRKAGATFVDVRSPAEYNAGHIEGACLDGKPRPIAPTTTIFYCSSPSCGRAHRVAIEARKVQKDNIFVYPGGYAEWIKCGLPIRTGESP